ncbi:uncharacterized protein LOC130447829 [Diorhabda sublineata]|uniref:uncharacterized protein LOC130447829 n=1 Tax=Diorhabda sublineata TaxID=1163346 RepID=UPI0024E17788|nr:uncharacterized protein LOC130447829 [Diorhabda sublineata]
MSRSDYLGSLLANQNKHQTILHNYFVTQDGNSNNLQTYETNYYAFQEPISNPPEPKVSIWEFLSKDDLKDFLKLHCTREIKNYLDSMKMNKFFPKGAARMLFIELMCSVTKFCQRNNYNLRKSGALLSQFFLTHILTTSSFDKTTEKVFNYFKELALAHALPDFPPKTAKIFSQDETKNNMKFFCKLYLRNLPLIRFTSLPNFAFFLYYEVDKQEEREKKVRKKQDGDKKKKKDSKKGSKAGSKKGKK